MKTTSVEIYIGHYSGNAQMWNTDYIDVPNEIMENHYKGKDITESLKKIYNKYLDDLEPKVKKGMPDISFLGIYSISEEEEGE